MQSINPASIMFFRISPSPLVLLFMLPLASTIPAVPLGAEFVSKVLKPGIIGITRRRYAVFPAAVVAQVFAAPIAYIKRRIGQDKIKFNIFVFKFVIQKGIAQLQLGINAADGEVHSGQAQGRGVRFLPVNRNILDITLMIERQIFRSARTCRLSHSTRHRHALCMVPAFRQAVSRCLRVSRTVRLSCLRHRQTGRGSIHKHRPSKSCDLTGILPEADGADKIDQFTEPLFVKIRIGINLGNTPLSGGLIFSMASIASSTSLPISGCLARSCRYCQRAFSGTKKTIVGKIFVPYLPGLRLQIRLCLLSVFREDH